MADTQIYKSKDNGSLWILPNGPNTKPEYLPCHDLEDISESRGGITLIQCVDENGEYKPLGATEDAPEPLTTTLGTYIGPVADFMETVQCPFALYVHLRNCGKADSFENYDRTFLLQVQKVTGVTLSGLVRKDEDVVAMHTFDVEALPSIVRLFRLTPLEEAVNEDDNINDIVFLDDPSCWDNCGESNSNCDYGYAVTDANAGSPSDVGHVLYKSPTSGGWQPTAADPFAPGEDIASVQVFKVGKNVNRILVARGTTDVGNPAEVAYSDDNGATWTNVNVGTVNGQFALGKKSLLALNRYNVYLVTTDGYIYYSGDGGESWTAQEAGTITTDDYFVIQAADENTLYASAQNGVVVKTNNGGTTWGAVTSTGADDNVALEVLSRDRVWVGTDAGDLFYTNNGGTTWNQRSYGQTTGTVQDVEFVNDYVAFLIHNVGGVGSVYFTINGGYSWELQTGLPTNTGLNVVYACDANTVSIGANAGQIISLTN